MDTEFELVVQLTVIVFLSLVILSILWWDGQRKTAISKRVADQQHIIVYDALPKEARD